MATQTFTAPIRNVTTAGFTSPGFTVPARLLGVEVLLTTDDARYDSVTGTIAAATDHSADGGGTWQTLNTTNFVFGQRGRDGQPSLRVFTSLDGLAGEQVRFRVTPSSTLRLGATITATTE